MDTQVTKYDDQEPVAGGALSYPTTNEGKAVEKCHASLILEIHREDGERGVKIEVPKVLLHDPGALVLNLLEYEMEPVKPDFDPLSLLVPMTLDLRLKAEIARDHPQGIRYTVTLLEGDTDGQA